MRAIRWMTSVLALCGGVSASALASDLSYTYLDFQYIQNTLETTGRQTNTALNQSVAVNAADGDGIAIAGAIRIRDRFYLSGFYHSSIIDVSGVVNNPVIGSLAVTDEFDYISTNVGFGYIHQIGENLDVTAEITYDGAEFDFGSFAGENFDSSEAGAGVKLGTRWNPTPRLELSGFIRQSPVGKLNISSLTFESDTLLGLGIRWYILEDLGISLDFESGEVDTATFSMRFSFGNLAW